MAQLMTKLTAKVVYFAIANAICVLPLSGCGPGGPPPVIRHKVTGAVKLDGKPLETGRINPIDLAGGGDGGEIKNGTFSMEATAGKKRVEIAASRVTDKNVEGKSDVKESASLIPEEYNAKSTLTAEIFANKPNELSFDLKSVP